MSFFSYFFFFNRDTYDKEVKAKLLEKPKHKQNKQKKPNLNVYVPPTKHKGSISNTSFLGAEGNKGRMGFA